MRESDFMVVQRCPETRKKEKVSGPRERGIIVLKSDLGGMTSRMWVEGEAVRQQYSGVVEWNGMEWKEKG